MLYAVVGTCIALTLLNLLLMLGVIRRLREQTELLDGLLAGQVEMMLPVGSRPDPFTATTVDDVRVTEADLSGGGLVAFFSPSCPDCVEWIPRFAEAAEHLPGGRRQALAVVVVDAAPADASGLVTQLRGCANVVVEAQEGDLAKSFQVRGFPSICRLDEDGVVAANVPSYAVRVAAHAHPDAHAHSH